MPDGYCSNLRNIVDPNEAKFNNMKSHNCYVFMETLLLIAFGVLLDDVLKPLVEISQFFKNLCSNNTARGYTLGNVSEHFHHFG